MLNEKFELWKEACKNYYSSEAIMSDPEFDELQDYLLENGTEEMIKIINSGIYRDNIEDVETVISETEMISLKKFKCIKSVSQTLVEVKKFLLTINGKTDYSILNELVLAFKFDGNALKITLDSHYADILSIHTRGGLDVTAKFKQLPAIQQLISLGAKLNKTIFCGELLLKKSIFERKYSEFANARNFVGSLMKQEDVDPSIIADLSFELYSDGLNPIGKNWSKVSLDSLHNIEKYFYDAKEKSDYLIDGLVLGYKETTPQRRIKDNYPLNMCAIKFKSPSAQAKIIGIEWTVKKSGKCTPVILIEPTHLDGSIITKCSGYNYEISIKTNKLTIGTIVSITKSGDIIPVIEKVISRPSGVPTLSLPDFDYSIDGKHLLVVNQEEVKINKFILGLRTLQLDGIGPEIAKKVGEIVDFDIIKLFDKQYKPDIRDILGGGKTFDKFAEFYNIKHIYLDQLIELIQFNNCGKTLSNKFALLITRKSNDVSGINKELLNYVCRGEGFAKIKNSMNTLVTFGVKVLPPAEISEETLTFEMTGTPPNKLTKAQIVEQIKARYPNSVHTTLTKDTKVLFVDSLESNSGKINKARKYNIRIVTYLELLQNKFKF